MSAALADKSPEWISDESLERDVERLVEVCLPEPTIARDVFRLILDRTFGGVWVEAPLPPGPKLFVTNHQISIDLLYLTFWLVGARREPCSVVAWDGLPGTHAGELLTRLLDRPGQMDAEIMGWARPRLLDTRDPYSLSNVFTKLFGGDGTPDTSVVVGGEGLRQYTDGQPVVRVGTAFVDGAVRAGMPVVPVRFAHALPERSHGHRFAWPHLLAPMRLHVGKPLAADHLRPLSLRGRRDRIAEAMTALVRPAPPGHRDINVEADRRVWQVVERFGVSQTKALLIDLLMTADLDQLSAEGLAVRRMMLDPAAPLSLDAGWLSDFGLWLTDGQGTLYPFMRDIYGDALCGPRRSTPWG